MFSEILNERIDLVQTGMSEKVPLAIQFITSFFAGFIRTRKYFLIATFFERGLTLLHSCLRSFLASRPRSNLNLPLHCHQRIYNGHDGFKVYKTFPLTLGR